MMTVLPSFRKIRLSLRVFPDSICFSLNVFLGEGEFGIKDWASRSCSEETVSQGDIFDTFGSRVSSYSSHADGHPMTLINMPVLRGDGHLLSEGAAGDFLLSLPLLSLCRIFPCSCYLQREMTFQTKHGHLRAGRISGPSLEWPPGCSLLQHLDLRDHFMSGSSRQFLNSYSLRDCCLGWCSTHVECGEIVRRDFRQMLCRIGSILHVVFHERLVSIETPARIWTPAA